MAAMAHGYGELMWGHRSDSRAAKDTDGQTPQKTTHKRQHTGDLYGATTWPATCGNMPTCGREKTNNKGSRRDIVLMIRAEGVMIALLFCKHVSFKFYHGQWRNNPDVLARGPLCQPISNHAKLDALV